MKEHEMSTVDAKTGFRLSRAAFEEFARTKNSFDACIMLAATGHGPPAEIIAGVVLLSALQVIWAVHQEPDDIDRRADLHARLLNQIDLDRRRENGLWRSLPTDNVLEGAELLEAVTLFGPDGSISWTGHVSADALVEDLVTLEDDPFVKQQLDGLKTVLARSHSFAIGSGVANQANRILTTKDEGLQAVGIKMGLGPEGVADALHTASSGFQAALHEMVTRYFPDLADQLRTSEAFLWRAWKRPEVLVGLSDGDPCPCDRPSTTWGQCHKWTESLGTTEYVPFTDADLVNFTPYSPEETKNEASNVVEFASDESLDVPDGPLILTFTMRLPFTLGLVDDGAHLMWIPENWADPDDVGHFGRMAFVRIRLRNEHSGHDTFWPENAGSVIQSLYPTLANQLTFDWRPLEGTYEQWVTLETPSGRLSNEDLEDRAYAFHRCLNTLNVFLTMMDLAVSDHRVRAVSTVEIGPVVIRGAYLRDGSWTRLGDLFMHPVSFPYSLPVRSFDSLAKQIEGKFSDIKGGRPFITANLWFGRAVRAWRFRGDGADCVVSLQTAAESMAHDLLRGILVDLGRTSIQIANSSSSEVPYKSLLNRELARHLGGSWDLTGSGAVGNYWRHVYELRNRVVHAGYTPVPREVEQAMASFLAFREFISVQLNAQAKRFPRTLLAKVGVNGLDRRGWLTDATRRTIEKLQQESSPWYWPRDIANR